MRCHEFEERLNGILDERGDPEADVLHRHPRPHAEDFLPEV